MGNPDHPTPALLARFARGEAARDETRAIARHLLAGCPQCAAVLWPAWKTADRLARRRAPHLQAVRRQRALHR